MSEITPSNIVVGGVVEITEGKFKGLWKITERKDYSGYESSWIRAKISKNTKTKEGEIIMEFYPEDKEHLFFFEPYNNFAKDAQPLPPPPSITIDENGVTYHTLDRNPENNGFEATCNGNTVVHWEYEDVTTYRQLQVYLDRDWVEIFLGEKVNTTFITIY